MEDTLSDTIEKHVEFKPANEQPRTVTVDVNRHMAERPDTANLFTAFLAYLKFKGAAELPDWESIQRADRGTDFHGDPLFMVFDDVNAKNAELMSVDKKGTVFVWSDYEATLVAAAITPLN